MRISDWSSDVCSSDLGGAAHVRDVACPSACRSVERIARGRSGRTSRIRPICADRLRARRPLYAAWRYAEGFGLAGPRAGAQDRRPMVASLLAIGRAAASRSALLLQDGADRTRRFLAALRSLARLLPRARIAV